MADLNSLVASAPRKPGVYLFSDKRGDVLYVGKATDLRRRLLDHTRAGSRIVRHAADVRWIECRDEMDALAREADLIAALRPSFNATIAVDMSYSYVCVDGRRIRLSEQPIGVKNYGAFLHLGKGKAYTVAVKTNAGLTALLRLMWVAYGEERKRFRLPAVLRGTSPPTDHLTPKDVARLHPFLQGTSKQLLRDVQEAMTATEVPEEMQRGLFDDLIAADEFYRLGPKSLRAMRLRHKRPADALDPATIHRMITQELE